WDIDSGRELGHQPLIGGMGIAWTTPDGLLTSSADGWELWPVQRLAESPTLLRIGPPHQLWGVSNTVVSTKDGRVVGSPSHQGARVIHRGKPDRQVSIGPHRDVRHLALSSDGALVATVSHSGPDGVK